MTTSTPADAHLREELTSRESLAKGNFLEVRRDTVKLPDGHSATREYVVHPGAVVVIPLLDDGRVVLERQFRYPVGQVMIEFPAGKLDAGEDPLVCGQRELLEETGYTAATWVHLGGFHNAFGYSDERIDVFLARGLKLERSRQDAGEVIEIFTAPWQEVSAWIRDGLVTDVKTIIGIGWLEKWLEGTWRSG